MDIQQVSRSEAQKVFVAIRNMSGGTINGNSPVCFDLGTTVDGVSVVAPATASTFGWAGIADADIADTGYGRAQCWGYRDSILVSHKGTSTSTAKGDALIILNGVTGVGNGAAKETLSTTGFKYIVAANVVTISAANYCAGIIRCL